jgi:hypothetical protein
MNTRLIARCTGPRPFDGACGFLRRFGWCGHFVMGARSPNTTIVTYVPADKSELKPGAKIFISAANKKEDGTLEAAAISVGRDGITPPM